MSKKFMFFMLLIIVSLMAPAQDRQTSWTTTFNNLRFGLHMAENNLFEARFILRLKNEIALTPAQEQKIENLMLDNEGTAIRRASDIKVLELKFAALLKDNRIDRREMEKMVRDMSKIKTDLQVNHLNYLLDVRDTLTAEQVQKIEKIKKEFAERMRSKMHERRGGNFRSPQPPTEEDQEPAAEKDH